MRTGRLLTLTDMRRRAMAPSSDPHGTFPAIRRMIECEGAAADCTARSWNTPACHSRPDREKAIAPRRGRLRARVVGRRWGQDPDGDARNRGQNIAGRETEHG